jgi:hypothetical protein
VPHIPRVDDFKYWQQQAAEARALAEKADDKVTRATILRMAGDCDKLALWSAARIQEVKVNSN